MSLIDTPTPPAVKGARLIRGLGDGPEERINHPAKIKQAKTKRLTSTEVQVVQFEFRQHMESLHKKITAVRKSNAASRKTKLAELGKKFGVSTTAIRVCVVAK